MQHTGSLLPFMPAETPCVHIQVTEEPAGEHARLQQGAPDLLGTRGPGPRLGVTTMLAPMMTLMTLSIAMVSGPQPPCNTS